MSAPANAGVAEHMTAPTVLVADDDPTSRLLIGAALEGHVSDIVEAENGAAAVRALERQRFELAILDLDMPVLDGFGVIEKARALPGSRHLPIIVVTGRDDVLAIERAFALGATSFLCKPINWNVFRHQVDYVRRVARVERDMRVALEKSERLAAARLVALAALEGEAQRRGAQDHGLARERLPALVARERRVLEILTGTTPFVPRRADAGRLAAEAIESVAATLGGEAAARVEMRCGATSGVWCDPRIAGEALAALLEGALEVSAGPVRLGIADVAGARIRFEILDGGPGMAEEILEGGLAAIAGSGGAGPRLALGIACAEATAERHGGHFGILSEPGIGTEMFLSLPAAQGEAAVNATAQLESQLL
jgi:two-component system sensor histidine kinase/response regulator